MLSHYNWTETAEGYEFSTISKLNYLAYFTDFYLQSPKNGTDVKVFSFGITCRESDDFRLGRKDESIRNTVILIIQDFFTKNSDQAVLYICMTDGSARERKITFGRWFYELADDRFEKHDCNPECTKEGLYSSLILKSDNVNKDEFINSFHYTIDSWFGNNDEPED